MIHLIRATLRYASRKYWDQIAKDLRAIYTAPMAQAAWARFEELEEKWGKAYPAIAQLWRAAWEEFTPFPASDVEIRRSGGWTSTSPRYTGEPRPPATTGPTTARTSSLSFRRSRPISTPEAGRR